jgi:beta-galactosidase
MKHLWIFSMMLGCAMPGMAANEPTTAVTPDKTSVREVVPMNFGWKFMYGDSLTADGEGWIDVNVPHDFQIAQPWVEPSPDERPDNDNPMANIRSRLSSRGFKEMGSGWYRKSFTPDPSWEGKRVLLDFEGILLVGDVYLNGEHIGGTDYGYLGFESDISKKLKYGQPNVIEVKADTGKPENSRWYTGAGIYRDVNIIVTDPAHYFTRHPLKITTPIATPEKSVAVIDGEIATRVRMDSLNVGIRILDKEGNAVYDKVNRIWNNRKQPIREFRLDSITVDNAKLWDCENPNLYTAEVTLYRPDGTVADRVSERFGFRTLEYSPEFGLKLNGKKVLLKGIANHHTLGALGAAAYPRALEKRIKLLKEFGFNHIRSSHNPYSESFLDLCDENGILVVDEIYDKWTKQFCGGRKEWSEQWQQTVPEWVRRDRNHPSIVMWSLGNELQLIADYPFNDWGVTPYHLQKTALNRYDTSRPVTVAMHPRGRNELTDSLPAPLVMETDIAAYNYRYMYFPGDGRRFPWMMFYQSEANTSNMGPNFFDMDLDKVIGLAYWGMIDYLGESHGWPAKGWREGVFDISLEPKPNAYFLKSYFMPDEPLVRIGVIEGENSTLWNDVVVGGDVLSSHWNYKDGSKLSLFTYTNADEVELIVNGKSLGRRPNNRENSKERNRIKWNDVPYAKGYIEAVAYNKGQKAPVSRHRLETAGNAVKLQADPDNASWKADGMDLQHVRVTAVDGKNRRDYGARENLKFEVDGPAEIVGVINGDMLSPELTVGDTRSLFNGSAVVILRSTQQPGEVKLKVTPAGKLKPTTLKLQTL